MKLWWKVKLVTVATVSAIGLSTIALYNRYSKSHIALAKSFVKQNLISQNRAESDVLALVNLGSRVAGTATNEKALAYLNWEYQKAGYENEIKSFTYPKFED